VTHNWTVLCVFVKCVLMPTDRCSS